MNNNKQIKRFLLRSKGYEAFSNMALYPINVDGKTWPTSEHYYQAMKFGDDNIREKIRLEPSPYRAAALGNDRKLPLNGKWEEIKVDVMRKAMHAKFDQHEELRSILMATGDERLIDHTAGDCFWGDGGNGSGKNMIGILLMEIRSKYQRLTGR